MGMSIHVVGIRPATSEYTKKLKAYMACLDAGVTPPDELVAYFGALAKPDPKGMEVSLTNGPALTRLKQEYKDGFDVDLSQLPDDVKILRFYVAY